MSLFKNKFLFSVLYFIILVVYLYVKFNADENYLRVFVKPFLMVSLLIFTWVNTANKKTRKFIYLNLAIITFLLGDIIIVFKGKPVLFLSAMLFFMMGKIFYIFRFSGDRDFKVSDLFPILAFCFFYILLVFNVVIKNLNEYVVPVLIYLLFSSIQFLFSFLRKVEVNFKSFLIVVIGVFFSVTYDTIALLTKFYEDYFLYNKITVVTFYAISQYLIVYGLVTEKIKPIENIEYH
ncbi:lysoplasmalogenase family protein [Neotamlana laminarinivorans]|uniref:Lysoplasmalogenase n=1 Tax=Neotamlana laminarinivorans TaxID=2883124 RepID=A0A9X1L1I1_9FLAO|nr:lysoplasmalogenase family protein [Tamlana laminarinivorans]MCB4798748.1 lysoplasmalogenase [Tamlana laminarinivorans]